MLSHGEIKSVNQDGGQLWKVRMPQPKSSTTRSTRASNPRPARCAVGLPSPTAIKGEASPVQRGKIVLAEFTYGGNVAPSFPSWLIHGTRPSRLAWLLKEQILPPSYWKAMLKDREWMAKSELADV